MSVPHLDTRVVDGEASLLFGPFATFSPKFLKNGSMFDIVSQVRAHNLWPMLRVAFANPDLDPAGHVAGKGGPMLLCQVGKVRDAYGLAVHVLQE